MGNRAPLAENKALLVNVQRVMLRREMCTLQKGGVLLSFYEMYWDILLNGGTFGGT